MEKTVAQIIEETKTIPHNKGVNLEAICYDLDIDEFDLDHDWSQIAERFSNVPFDSWTCWDTPVGKNLIFYDGEPVAITCQSARKADVEVFWIGKESAVKIRGFLLSLIRPFGFDIRCQFINDKTVVPIEGESGVGISTISIRIA